MAIGSCPKPRAGGSPGPSFRRAAGRGAHPGLSWLRQNFLDTREEAEQFYPNKRDGSLCLGDLSECGHIAVIRNPRCTSWQSRKPRELLISSRLPLPARITITKTWGG